MFAYTVRFESRIDRHKFNLTFISDLTYHHFKSWLQVTYSPSKVRIISIIGKRA